MSEIECPIRPATAGDGTDVDPLTGLPGDATLRERFEAATLAARRDGKRLGILAIAPDGTGPADGDPDPRATDTALRHVARCLDASVRGADTVSRKGPRGFVVLLTDLDVPADAARVAQHMLARLMPGDRDGAHAAGVSASIGISIEPDDGCDLDELVGRADAAMHGAQRQGRGRYAFHGGQAPAGSLCPATVGAPFLHCPLAEPMARERARQDQMQEANEHLLLAALSAQALQSTSEHRLGDQAALMARVAHELRNPLTPIGVAASLLDAAHMDELPQLRALIERQVDHMARLVGDLLDVSRAGAGKLRLLRSVLDLRGVVADALAAVRPAIAARGQQLVIDLPAQPLPVDGDRVRLAQVLSNLIDNASKYTPPGGVVTVAAHAGASDVEVRVSDTGIGIRPDALATVFDPFVQESHATRFNGTGLGIGLTVVRELVEAHGGHVQAFSAGEGQGSELVVTLPRRVGDGEPESNG